MPCIRLFDFPTGNVVRLALPSDQESPTPEGTFGLRDLLNPSAAALEVIRRHEQALAAAFADPAP